MKEVIDSQIVPNAITSSSDGTEQIPINRRIIFPALEPSFFTAFGASVTQYRAATEKGPRRDLQCGTTGISTDTWKLNGHRSGVTGAVSNTELIELLDEVERVLSLDPCLPKLEHHWSQ